MNQGNDQGVWTFRLYDQNLQPCPYKMGRPLGKGSFGDVYQCVDSFGQDLNLACKVINKAKHSNWTATKEELRNEIECLVLVKNHARVTNLVNVHETEFDVLIVMDLCSGGTLRNLMNTFGHFNEPTAMWLFHKLLEGVAYCHGKGVVNRDIKPDNVLVANPPPYDNQNSPQLKLADFGLSGVLPAEPHATLSGCSGTLKFMAPEVLRYKQCNAKADVWALGIILYMMLKHVHPFEISELQRGNFKWIPRVWENISQEMRDFLENKLLVFDLRNRSSAQLLLYHPWVVRFKD